MPDSPDKKNRNNNQDSTAYETALGIVIKPLITAFLFYGFAYFLQWKLKIEFAFVGLILGFILSFKSILEFSRKNKK